METSFLVEETAGFFTTNLSMCKILSVFNEKELHFAEKLVIQDPISAETELLTFALPESVILDFSYQNIYIFIRIKDYRDIPKNAK